MKTYYDILEITTTASTEVVLAAHKALTKKYHPDVSHAPDALQKMQEINNARDTLIDTDKRQAYDKSISSQQQQQQTNTTQNVNVNNKIKTQTVRVNGSEVQFKYYFENYTLFIHFWTKDSDVFNKIKDIVKLEYFGKWNQQTKYWACDHAHYMSLLRRFSLNNV